MQDIGQRKEEKNEAKKSPPFKGGDLEGGEAVPKEIFNKPSTLEKRKKLRENMTEPEKLLWNYIKKEQLEIKFRRQHSIGEYIADFYSPKLKLVIEIDGDSHFTEEAVEYDKIRTQYFNSLGIEVIRFTNEDVIENIEGVVFIISERIKKVQR